MANAMHSAAKGSLDTYEVEYTTSIRICSCRRLGASRGRSGDDALLVSDMLGFDKRDQNVLEPATSTISHVSKTENIRVRLFTCALVISR